MLKILNIEKKEWAGDIPDVEGGIVIAADDYYIQRMEDGRDELHFTIQTADPAYVEIQEETRIIETTENQTYAVKTIELAANRQTSAASWIWISGEPPCTWIIKAD